MFANFIQISCGKVCDEHAKCLAKHIQTLKNSLVKKECYQFMIMNDISIALVTVKKSRKKSLSESIKIKKALVTICFAQSRMYLK